jgi:hypothetical protein
MPPRPKARSVHGSWHCSRWRSPIRCSPAPLRHGTHQGHGLGRHGTGQPPHLARVIAELPSPPGRRSARRRSQSARARATRGAAHPTPTVRSSHVRKPEARYRPRFAGPIGRCLVASFAHRAAPLMVVGGLIVAGWANIGVSGFRSPWSSSASCWPFASIRRDGAAHPERGRFYAYISRVWAAGSGSALCWSRCWPTTLQFGLFGTSARPRPGSESRASCWATSRSSGGSSPGGVAITALFGVLRVDPQQRQAPRLWRLRRSSCSL